MNNKFYYSATLAELINDNSEPPNPIIDNGILLDGTILFIIGPPKHKKTFLTQNIAVSIASGVGFSGFEVISPKRIIYFLAEGGRYPMRDRFKKMCVELDTEFSENLMLSLTSFIDITNDEDFQEIIDRINKFKADVAIFDPLSKFHSVEENSASAMSNLYGRIRQLIETLEISVIIVHHTGKIVQRGGRGSNTTQAEYDSCIMLNSDNDNTKIHFDMRHVETPSPTKLRFNSDTLWFEKRDGMLVILENAGGMMDKKEFFERCGMSRATAYRDLKKAKEKNMVKDEDGVLELLEHK